MKLRKLLRRIVVGPGRRGRVPAGSGADDRFTDIGAVKYGGLRGSQWTVGQEKEDR
jgi:hypothetical protein